MSITDTRKLPPQSIEAEMSILGGILLDNEAINRTLEILTPEDLYRENHRKIFRAMIELNERNEPCDLVTLTAILKKKDELEEGEHISPPWSITCRLPRTSPITAG